MASQVSHVAEAVREHHRPTMRKLATVEEREAAMQAVKTDSETFGAETFARLYNDPEKVADAKGWAPSAHAIADELPEWSSLREAVKGDPDFSAMAAQEVLSAIAGRLPELLKSVDQEAEQQAQQPGQGSGAGEGQPTPGDGNEEGDGQGQRRSDQLGKAGQQLRAALRGACDRASKQVSEAREAMESLAPGSAYAPPTHEQKDSRRLELAQTLLRNPNLRAVLRKAGKLVRLAERTEARKDPRACGLISGVTLGNDLPRVLPSQLALLGNPALKVLVMKGLAERSLPQYKVEGKTPQGKGPICILADESGSMKGAGETWAKAAILACLQLGQKEKREVAVVMFNHGISDAWIARTNGKVETLPSTSPKGATAKPWGKVIDLALELCTRHARGGTDFNAPLFWGLEYLESQPRADLLFITDGCADASPKVLDMVKAAKAALGLRVFGMTVGGGSISPAVRSFCDESIDIDKAEDAEKAASKVIPVRR
jgi:uncharacterized protein with von Willebrand factor type A (vWA) domain